MKTKAGKKVLLTLVCAALTIALSACSGDKAGKESSQITIGIMSTVLDYPMAKTLIQVGLVFTSVMLLVASIRSAREKHRLYWNIILRCAVFIIIAILFLLLPEKLFQTA